MFIFYFLFILPQDLQAPLAYCRETLPHDQNLGVLYNASPKIRGHSPKKFVAKNMQNLGRFYTTSDFHLEYLWILERVKIPKIGKMWRQRFLPRSAEKVWWTLVHQLESRTCEFGSTKWTFLGDYISAFRECCRLKFLHALQIDHLRCLCSHGAGSLKLGFAPYF